MKKIQLLILVIVNLVSVSLSAQTNEYFKIGSPVTLKWDSGPISLGMVMDLKLVPVSGKNSQDLMISRIWQGVLTYPSRKPFSEQSLLKDPYFSGKGGILLFDPVDWDKDGTLDLIGADRFGFLYLIPGKGKYPNINYEVSEATIMRDKKSNLPFNIPAENPNNAKPDDLGGYRDHQFHNYLYPIIYSPDSKYRDLIIGDWAGYLWWLPEYSKGMGCPSYSGIKYTMEKTNTVSGINYQKDLGMDYSKPAEKILDENGQPFLLGTGKEAGKIYQGANTRPIIYPDEFGKPGLLVICGGSTNQEFVYLKRVNSLKERKPVFRNMGDITISGLNPGNLGFHTKVCLYKNNGRNDLLLAYGNHLAALKNTGWEKGVPRFAFTHWIEGENVTGSFYAFNDILTDHEKRYILHYGNKSWNLIPIEKTKEGIRLHYTDSFKLKDQHGIFHVDGETDPQMSPDWGYHRITRWDFDGSGRNHLVAATDKGLLFLLKDDPALSKPGEFIFRSSGPLKDSSGDIIKIHNRAVAASMDLNGDGRKDLVVGGISYQLGVKSDPHPGGGVYYMLNEGIDSEGLPVLSPPKTLDLGIDFKPRMNSHIGLQVLDLDHDGEEEVIISLQDPGWNGRIFHKVKGRIALEYTRMRVPVIPINEQVLDIDGDQQYELISPGGERGVGYYHKLERIN